ncbi:MAG TPA: protein kinase, partial [Kofleriaceae bacterium]
MSDQDNTRAGGTPYPGAPGNNPGGQRSPDPGARGPHDATTVLPQGAGAPVQPVKQRTMVGVGAAQFGINTVQAPPKPSTLASGSAPPGTQAPVAPPQAHTMHAKPRAKRDSNAPSGFNKSAWDTFDSSGLDTSGTTGVHATSAAPHPGVRINQYEMIKLIGEGGMGSVFLARDLRLGRRVAIKFLQSNQPELTQRFLVEARTTARCQHDNIVVIYEVGEHNGAPYIVLEYLSGKPLTHLTENSQRLP